VIPADRLPVRLTISRLSIDAGVVPVGVGADRSLMLPEPRRTGWWIGGAQPGDRQGTVVIAGHVDAADGSHGALYPLTSLRTGDDIQVGTTAGPVAYHVVAMRSFFKQRLPTDLFSRSGAPRLVLITCGGRYQPGSGYTKNVVAYAVPG
jgi:hypothetical protein